MGSSAPSASKITKEFKRASEQSEEARRITHDPGGVVYTSKEGKHGEYQAMVDVGGIGAQKTLMTRAAEASAAKQEALIAEQQRKVEAEQARQDKAKAERTARLKSNELLFGSETGLTGSKKASLLR